MKSTVSKTITFSRKGLKLEEILRLVFFDTDSYEFDKDLHSDIEALRRHSEFIKGIGYDENMSDIYVEFVFPRN